ncbi:MULTISPECIES: hypothetical protein [Erwinia]|uniref:hypothetical protein n=1 Tax=Erwinia TaxID=551 RepID=UPI00105E3001|nr:hypothetical protein [Erwinia aphidicola]MCP2234023.1 hypothetical protein [Erwinia aphidicola]
MRKSLKIASITIVIGIAALAFARPWIEMEFAGSAHYTQQDSREYNFYTPEVLKKMPRISERYDFDFANVTGPASHVYAVKFYDSKDTDEINKYLSSSGYQKQGDCDEDTLCWKGADPQETIYVGSLKGENTVIVQVVYDFT